MSDPDDHEWLLMRERGEDVSHIPAATRAAYDELIRLLAELPEREPDPSWKQRALAAIEPRRWRWAIAGGLAAAAAVAAAMFLALCRGNAGHDRPGAPRARSTLRRSRRAHRLPWSQR